MKTKNLFLATALMASFAACTNEEIVLEQQNVAAGRPTVDNVKLTFGENVDSRLAYVNKSWEWEATDKIGALLMDNVANINSTVWQDRYSLTQYIHTSYPFSYNVEDGTWGTPGKLLEGNYFFAFPWESYEGQRQVSHSLINQKQTGITADVRAESYADNQFFIGYDRIIAGTQDAEALNNVNMTSILGAIELRIVNVGTQTYNINKVVLSGDQLTSQLTFDPSGFNTANYLGLENEAEWNLDLKVNADYDKHEALRKVVKAQTNNNTVNNDKFAQIIIEGEDRALLPDAENTAYVLIMANPVAKGDLTNLKLSIYADEGMVAGINLMKANNSTSNLNIYGYKTDAKVTEIHPQVKNVITVQLDDNAFEVPEEMNVYNTQDLEQLIAWNATISGKRDVIVTLEKDVTLTEEAYEALVAKKNMTLTINGSSKVLTLAEELPIDVLENENLDINSKVKALCDIELTEDSNLPASIEVAEGAELTINDAFANVRSIVNNGTLTIGENANIKSGSSFINNGEMSVAEEAIVKNTVYNYGKATIEGYVKTISENGAEAEITLGEKGMTTVTTNEGIITTEGSLEVGTNKADAVINYEGGDIKVTTNNGESRAKISGTIDEEEIEDYMAAINTWVVVADVTFDDTKKALSFATVEVKNGADIVVEEKTTVSVTKMIVEGTTTIEGAMTIATLDIEKAGKLTVDEDAVLSTTTINNKGVVKNNGTVKKVTLNTTEGDWRGNDAKNYPASTADMDEAKAEYIAALADVVEYWVNNSYAWNNTGYKKTVVALDYNLNKAASSSTAKDSAKDLFESFFAEFAGWTDAASVALADAVEEAFDAYVEAAEDIDVDTDEWAITDEYAEAVTAVVAEYCGNTGENGAYVKADDKYTTLVEAFVWNAPADVTVAATRIYKDTKDAKNNTITAATNALKAFQTALINNEIKNGAAPLSVAEKTMVITKGENKAPACTQVFVTDLIYDIFNATSGIAYTQDWKKNAGFDGEYQTKDNASAWRLDVVKKWIVQAAKDTNNSYAKVAKAYVEANNNAVLTQSENWTYNDLIIQAIVADQTYNKN